MRVVFMGSPDFAVPALQALLAAHTVTLVITAPDKPAGRGKLLRSPPVKLVAEAAGIPVYQPTSARAPEFVDRIAAADPEVCVVVAYGKILPAGVLELAPRGCLNIHGSLLPKYRGAAPIQWALIRGEDETGVTIMKLDEGMDTGPILRQRTIRIEPQDTAGTIHHKLAPIGADLLIETLDRLAAGTLEQRPQDNAAATRAPMLNKRDGVVDWSASARDVCNRIRGVDPWPGAVSTWRGARLKLFGASVCEGSGRAGELLGIGPEGLRVACGERAVHVAQVQAPGKQRMAAAAFASGRAIDVGTILGA